MTSPLCTTTGSGTSCPTTSSWATCRPWDLTKQNKTNCYVDTLQQESLNIAGAIINVHKLLGIHEQTKLVDATGNGTAISGGDRQTFPCANAFTTYNTSWISKQAGANVTLSSFLGYDFGVLKLPNGREQYGVRADVFKNICTIKIKQSSNSNMRCTKARIERSNDGVTWYGVSMITLPDNDALNTVYFKQSVPSRFWRLRPTAFNGADCDAWEVQALEMSEYDLTSIDTIQDRILFENRNRDYLAEAITLKGYYELMSSPLELMQIGVTITQKYQIKVNFNDCVSKLGRPIIIGDIIELPSEVQYTPTLTPVKKFVQVSDVDWDTTSYTPGWQPTMLLITTQPAMATEETQDIFGDLAGSVDSSGLLDTNDGNAIQYQDYSDIDQTIANTALQKVPETGDEGSNTFREFTPEEISQANAVGIPLETISFNRTALFVEDAMPQNGAPYTEGETYPTSPSDGDYHRIVYPNIVPPVPAQLYRYSASKGRWVFLEKDRRAEFNSIKPILAEYTNSPTKTPASSIK